MTSDGVPDTNLFDLLMCLGCMAAVCFCAWLIYKYATSGTGRHR